MRKKDSFIPDSVRHAHVYESIRTWQLATLLLIGVAVALACVIVLLFPLKETETHFVQFSTSEDVFFKTIPKEDMNAQQENFLVRKFLRQYVDYRETRDNVDQMAKRFKTVKAMSTPDVFKRFKERYRKQKQHMDDITRDVYIISDSRISENVHQIEFKTVDKREQYSSKNLWFATITYDFGNSKVNEDIALRNPLNIKVKKYKISKRNEDVSEDDTSEVISQDSPFNEEDKGAEQ